MKCLSQPQGTHVKKKNAKHVVAGTVYFVNSRPLRGLLCLRKREEKEKEEEEGEEEEEEELEEEEEEEKRKKPREQCMRLPDADFWPSHAV